MAWLPGPGVGHIQDRAGLGITLAETQEIKCEIFRHDEGASDARLRGSDISWRSSTGRFHGRVEGDRILGDDGRVLARER